MSDRHLFLFGGGAPFNVSLGEKFAKLSSIRSSKVAILFIERDGWKEYMPKYTDLLEQHGVTEFMYLPLTSSPSIEFIEQLRSASGIIISGGDTELYRDYVVNTKVGQIVKTVYAEGIPIAGFSAGALISPEVCVIPPIDNRQNEHLFLQGLGLISNCVISAHYSEWNEEENLRAALMKTRHSVGYGIDGDSGVYFKNERIAESAGQVYFHYASQE